MSIRRKFTSSSFWVIVGTGSSNLATFAVFVILARLLGPKDFGLVAFATIFTEMARLLVANGLQQALVSHPEWTDDRASTAFWLNMMVASVAALFLAGVVGPALGSLFDPQLPVLLAALSLMLVIDVARATHEAKLQREFGYKWLATRTFAATALGGVLSVALAFYGFGVWALVIGQLGRSVVRSVIVWGAVSWRPSMRFSRATARSVFANSARLGGATLFTRLNGYAPELVIGIFLGTVPIAYYRVGWRVVGLMNQVFVHPIQAPALSALSRLAEKGSLAPAYLRLASVIALLSFPVYFGIAIVASDFVAVALGERWRESGAVMSVLALGGAAGTIVSLSTPTLVAAGLSNVVFARSLVSVLSTAAIAVVLSPFGLTAIAMGVTAQSYAFAVWTIFPLKRAIGVPLVAILSCLSAPFFSSFVMAAVLVFVRDRYLLEASSVARLAILVPLGAGIYALAVLAVGRKSLLDLWREFSATLARGVKQSSQA